jgi:hypothetical protein
MAEEKRSASEQQHGIFLSVEEIERIVKAFRDGMAGPRNPNGDPIHPACGILVCGS